MIAAIVASGVNQQRAYDEVVGESLDTDGWRAVLAEAAGSGFLREIDQDRYVLHPTLPQFIRTRIALLHSEGAVRVGVTHMCRSDQAASGRRERRRARRARIASPPAVDQRLPARFMRRWTT
jgi:hypothetical protein